MINGLMNYKTMSITVNPTPETSMKKTLEKIDETLAQLENQPEPPARSNMDDCAICCIATSGGVFILAFIGGFVTFLVFSMIGICSVSLRTTQNRCSDSNLWIWSLIYTVHSIAGLIYGSKQSKSEEKNPLGVLCSLLVSFGFLIWGIIEYWGVSCVDNLSNLLLYKLAFVQLILGICIFGGFIIAFIWISIKQCFCSKK